MAKLPEKASDLQLEAAELGRRIDQILEKLHENEFIPAFKAEIAQTIQFFGINLAQLQLCSDDIIKLAGIFVETFEHWSLDNINILFMLLTTALVERRKQRAVRRIAKALTEFVKKLSKSQLKSIGDLHNQHNSSSSPLLLIFHKLRTASTFYTQLKIIEILNIVASVLDDKGSKIIKQERIISSLEVAEEAFTHFKNINRSNFVDSSRQFLKFYNEKIVQKPHVYSIEGFLFAMNEAKSDKAKSGIIVDFNLRDFSISFFANGNQWRDSEDNREAQHFFELLDCDVKAVPLKNQQLNHVVVIVKPTRYHVLDELDGAVDDVQRIQSIHLVISNKNNLFKSKILPLLEKKVKRHNNDNMIELAMINNLKTAVTSFTRCSLDHNQSPEATNTIHQPTRAEKRLFPRELELQAVMSPLKKVRKTTTPRQAVNKTID